MGLFQAPPPTRYDLHFAVAGIPVRVHPLFWLIVLLLGATGDILQLLIWVVVVFVSILVHELGHSLTMRLYGQDSIIVLHGFGGLAIPTAGGRLDDRERVITLFAGPVAGFLLAALVLAIVVALGGVVTVDWLFGVIPFPRAQLPGAGVLAFSLVGTFLWVNIFWGLLNLLPIFPLDGGQIARHVLVENDPLDGLRRSLWLSAITGALLAIAGLLLFRSLFMALLFGLLALQSYQMTRGAGRPW